MNCCSMMSWKLNNLTWIILRCKIVIDLRDQIQTKKMKISLMMRLSLSVIIGIRLAIILKKESFIVRNNKIMHLIHTKLKNIMNGNIYFSARIPLGTFRILNLIWQQQNQDHFILELLQSFSTKLMIMREIFIIKMLW